MSRAVWLDYREARDKQVMFFTFTPDFVEDRTLGEVTEYMLGELEKHRGEEAHVLAIYKPKKAWSVLELKDGEKPGHYFYEARIEYRR